MLLTVTKHKFSRLQLRWFSAHPSIRTSFAMSTVNGRVLFVEPPITYIEPGKHIRYSEEKIDLPSVALSGGVLVKTLILSPDPYMRGKLGRTAWPVGSPLSGYGIGLVVRSESSNFKQGEFVYSSSISWEHYAVYPARSLYPLGVSEGVPLSYYLGVLGMPGLTAWYGLKNSVGHLSKGETLFVSAASGAVGSVVVQLAKIWGLKVIGSAGRDDKVAFLKDEIGADVAFNYKTEDPYEVLSKHGPVDVFFDNTNGPQLDAALANANVGGRFVICGHIYNYGRSENYSVKNTPFILTRDLTVRALSGSSRKGSKEFYEVVTPLVQSGKIKYKETRVTGLEHAGQALADLLTGGNFGKSIVVVGDDA